MSDTLIKALQNPALYPHPVTQFEVVQTHLSWVILTGTYAYKIKKPLNLGFQDFSTLEKRQHYCQLELQYNQAFTPDLYLAVVAITGDEQHPAFNGNGSAIEYAIQMRQFDQHYLLNKLAHDNQLTTQMIQKIAERIAVYHQQQPGELKNEFGQPELVWGPMQDNFTALITSLGNPTLVEKVRVIQRWAEHQFEQLKPLLAQRKGQGYIRGCHGDLHLGNIVLIGQEPTIFDCIEFNESFRYIDVMNDVAFMAMDLQHLGFKDLSQIFVNTYFEHTQDYEGALLLKLYQSYRAMVRAKVLQIQVSQLKANNEPYLSLAKDVEQFIDLALNYTQKSTPELFVTVGPSGSGKTIYTTQLLQQTEAIRIRADSTRKAMFANVTHEILYDPKTTEVVYHRMQEIANLLLQHGVSVIIDATCLKQWQRELFIEIGREQGINTALLVFECPQPVLEKRIEQRIKAQHDISDATISVLSQQMANAESLTDAEQELTRKITIAEVDALIQAKRF